MLEHAVAVRGSVEDAAVIREDAVAVRGFAEEVVEVRGGTGDVAWGRVVGKEGGCRLADGRRSGGRSGRTGLAPVGGPDSPRRRRTFIRAWTCAGVGCCHS
ncbi:hypothetical protein AB0M95_00015 [Sphaerisporangium sp. NPDC051017]|uniref:hypothetical protein n=1 Tax=Sphaerisporangium sp. NPDC051017 TaxID=3154636 RepID=UPI00343C73F2